MKHDLQGVNGMRAIFILAMVVLLGAMMVIPASATMVTFHPGDDARIDQYDADGNWDDDPMNDLAITSSTNQNLRTLIRSDLSSIPPGATIDSATLCLYMWFNNEDRTCDIHRITDSWTETEVTWNNQPSYESTPTSSTSVGTTYDVWVEWDVASNVQAFVDGTTNYGWLIKDNTEDEADMKYSFYKNSECLDDPTKRPYLEVTYTEGAASPDLTPTSIVTDSLIAGVPAAITVDVSNIGTAAAGQFNVTLKVEETVIDNETVASLGAGSNVPVVFTWTPDAAGTFNLTAIVDSDDAVAESNETNNELTREVTVEEQSTPTPPTSFLISGNITYDNGNPVMNPAVTVTNLVTSEDFTVKTATGSNYYLTLTDSTHIATGNTILINATDGSVSSEIERTVTVSEMNDGGFIQDMQLESGDRPDLIVTEKSEEWINPVDKTYTITYTVENSGTSDSGATTTSIKIDGTEVATDPVPALAIGENYTGTVGTFTLSGDNDTIEVCADSAYIINELDETNNCLSNVLEESSLPDLTIWVALKTPGYANEQNILGVRVKNSGSGDAGSFDVSLSIDSTPVLSETISSLAANETTELEYQWTPTSTGEYALSATADSDNVVQESDETNNDYARTSVIIKRTDWPQFHYDEVHSGSSPSDAPDTNQTLWISDELSAIGGTSTVVADGKVFAYGGPTSPYGSGEGVLYSLDESTGAIIWNISIPTPAYGSWSSPTYHNGRVFTSTDIEAGCYDATTGEQIWVFENPTNEPSVNGGPVVADGKVIVNDWQAGHFYCLDEETGELLWTFSEEQTGQWDVGYTQGVPAYEDGKFYFTTWIYVGGNVYCVDADTGDMIWNQTTPLDACGSPAVVDGTVYVTNYNFYGDGAIYAMDASNGDILWHQTIQRTDSTPAVAYGNVYVTGGCLGFSERQTYCFDAATGDLVWETDTAYEIGAWTCSVAVADGKVFVGSEGGDYFDYAGTYALNATTGDVIWSHPEGGSSPAVADNIVFTIGGGRVYAFHTGQAELPDLTVTTIETPANLRNDVINPITAVIANIGEADSGSFDVSLEIDNTPVDTTSISSLAPGENTTVELLWTPSSTGTAQLSVIADPDNSVTESNETNNDLSQSGDVLDKLTVTANVRIEGKNDTVWTGDVTFSSSTITASDSSIHYLNEPTALGALDEADKLGTFGYVVSNEDFGLYVTEVNSEPAIGWDGWMYSVNYICAMVGASEYTLANSDDVLWYFGAWTALPLIIELDKTGVDTDEEFTATVTAFNGTVYLPVNEAGVYVDGILYDQTGSDGMLTMSLDTAGTYRIHAEKGTWADYTRSEKKTISVTGPMPNNVYLTPVQSYASHGETALVEVYADTADDFQGGQFYLEFQDSCANIIDITFNEMWLYTSSDLSSYPGAVFATFRKDNPMVSGHQHICTVSVECVNTEYCTGDLHFALIGEAPSSKESKLFDDSGTELGDITWNDGTFTCMNLPDLVITQLHGTQTSGNDYTVTYTVVNTGNAGAATDHVTSLNVDGSWVEDKSVPVALAPGESYTDTFVATLTMTAPNDHLNVCADTGDAIMESDDTNNCMDSYYPAGIEVRVDAPDDCVDFQEQFTVNITVDPRNIPVYGVEYVLSFDNSVLHAEWQNEGDFLNHDGAGTNVYINNINNGAGIVAFAATRYSTPDGVTDPGILATIKFTAIQQGGISDLNLSNVVAANNNGLDIQPIDLIDDSVCVDENNPPVAVGKSMHKYNNEGEKYICKTYLDGSGSYDPDGEVVYWRWGFGDGTYGAGETVDHVYLSWNWNGAGYDPFSVSLTVTDNADPHQLDDAVAFDVIVYTAGDANGDGKVNILDATIVGLEWGEETTCGAYCWDGHERADRADLNNDGKVNILDAVIIGTCWGHTA